MASSKPTSDTFICGSCTTSFTDLVAFLEHKRSTSCGVTLPYSSVDTQENVTLLAEAPAAEGVSAKEVDSVVSQGVSDTGGSTSATNSTEQTDQIQSGTRKKKGRPKKVVRETDVEQQMVKPKSKTASIGKDGLFCCDMCKTKFKRERHFTSHKCKSANDVYLKPEDIPELEEGFDSRIKFPVSDPAEPSSAPDQEMVEPDDDETEDYNPGADAKQLKEDAENEPVDDEPADDSRPYKRRNIVGSDPKKKLASLSNKRKIATYTIPQSLDDIPDIPVFPDVESRKEFEKKEITIVDLSHTYDMYKTHLIEQTLNSNAISGAPKANGDISLHSCNTCDKVFKSLSHIRHHCLTHIDTKPFKCPECSFRANSKGNIYSHMRKHTGQMYRCRTCEFKSVNKSHLLEHEATHSGTVHTCALCQKHYSTTKSLINHVRIYHSKTDEGKLYHQKFVHVKEGPGAAMLFECHICDRKFKKESDRDRHLYVHNVRVERTVFDCQLCKYETPKQSLIDTHYLKHIYVYRCSVCDSKAASVQTLLSHLNSEHFAESAYEVLTPECIQKSLYLPEVKRTVIDDSHTSQANTVTHQEESEVEMFTRLGYLPMTNEIFDSIREKYGDTECEECGSRFKTTEQYEDHIKHHKGEKPFLCEYCDYTAYSKNSLKLHINARHEDKLFKCSLCEFVSKNKLALVDHKNRHETFKCPLCEQYLAGRKGLRNHLLSKHSDVDAESARKMSGYGRRTDAMKSGKAFKCPYCEKMFTNNNVELQKHIWVHEGIKPFKCDLCAYSCRTRSNLTSHMLRHTEQKPFPCVYCGKRYKSKTALRWHERSHASGRLFKCDKCDYEGIQKSHLIRHLETHNLVKRYSCNHCYYSANTIGYMRVHYTRCHPGVTYTQSDGGSCIGEIGISGDAVPPNVYKCVSCDYLFGNLSDMKRHLRNKHRIHMTDINVMNGQEVVTQIVPLQNQDGITSDVQIVRIPMDGNVETDAQFATVIQNADRQDDSTFIVAGELGEAGIQLVKSMDVEVDQEGELQTVVMDYTSDEPSIMNITAADDTVDSGSQIFVQALPSEPTITHKGQAVSLLKSSHTNITTCTAMECSEEIMTEVTTDVNTSD